LSIDQGNVLAHHDAWQGLEMALETKQENVLSTEVQSKSLVEDRMQLPGTIAILAHILPSKKDLARQDVPVFMV
jgi:hypothetical protein